MPQHPILLFDIDGTLLETGGAGGIAFARTLQSQFGIQEPKRVPMHGRTDAGILGELFQVHAIEDSPSNRERFFETYFSTLPQVLGERPGRILPGALTLLESLSKTQASLSLLTGNTQRGAHMKLDRYGIGHYFHGGVFGDLHSHRVELGQLAQSTISQQLNRSVHPDAMIVIGDTTLDIDCARTIGCRVLAVATGGNRADELVNHGADWVVDDLTHPQVLEWLLEI